MSHWEEAAFGWRGDDDVAFDVACARRMVSTTKAPSYSFAISSTTATAVVCGSSAPTDPNTS